MIIGNMGSGKTEHLIIEVESKLRKYGGLAVIVFKPTTDTRSGRGVIKSRRGLEMEAFEIPSAEPWKVFQVLEEQEKELGKKFDYVVFDEVQFFSVASEFVWVVNELLQKGYNVIAAGLALNFRGRPFGSTLSLAAFAQRNIIWLDSVCTEITEGGVECGKRAILPQRFLPDGVTLAPYEDKELFIGDESKENERQYHARCCDHFRIPPRSSMRIS